MSTVNEFEHRPAASTSAALPTLAVASLGFFMVTLDVTIVNVALPTIGRDLGANLQALQWIVDGYALTFAAALMTGGALGDSFGARCMFAIGLGVFALASAGCGLATSPGILIGARFIQGFGAALVVPCSLALVHSAYPDVCARSHAVAVWSAAGGAAVAAGPVIGGVLVHTLSWHAIFLVNVLVGVIALVVTFAVVQSVPRVARRIDLAGQITAMAAIGGLTFALIEGPRLGLDAPVVWIAIVVTVAGAMAFIRCEQRAGEPMLPLTLVRRPAFMSATLAGALLNLAFYGQVFVLSLFFQQIMGQSALQAGLSFLPMTAFIMVANLSAPYLAARIGATTTIVAGGLLAAAGLASVLAVGPYSRAWLVAGALLPIGIGVGLSIPPLTSRMLDAVPATLAGAASGAFNATRQVGGAIGVALFGALLGDAAQATGFMYGMRWSLVIASAVTLIGVTFTLILADNRGRTANENSESS